MKPPNQTQPGVRGHLPNNLDDWLSNDSISIGRRAESRADERLWVPCGGGASVYADTSYAPDNVPGADGESD